MGRWPDEHHPPAPEERASQRGPRRGGTVADAEAEEMVPLLQRRMHASPDDASTDERTAQEQG